MTRNMAPEHIKLILNIFVDVYVFYGTKNDQLLKMNR